MVPSPTFETVNTISPYAYTILYLSITEWQSFTLFSSYTIINPATAL